MGGDGRNCEGGVVKRGGQPRQERAGSARCYLRAQRSCPIGRRDVECGGGCLHWCVRQDWPGPPPELLRSARAASERRPFGTQAAREWRRNGTGAVREPGASGACLRRHRAVRAELERRANTTRATPHRNYHAGKGNMCTGEAHRHGAAFPTRAPHAPGTGGMLRAQRRSVWTVLGNTCTCRASARRPALDRSLIDERSTTDQQPTSERARTTVRRPTDTIDERTRTTDDRPTTIGTSDDQPAHD